MTQNCIEIHTLQPVKSNDDVKRVLLQRVSENEKDNTQNETN